METLRLPAIELRQSTSTVLLFAADGKQVPRFASVPHIGRDESGLRGFQRIEILRHVDEIRSYIESEAPVIPNALVLALDERVSFEAATSSLDGVRSGHVLLPLDCPRRPAIVVDGQQRLAAIRDAEVARFPVAVCAFPCDSLERLREQFILVNNVRPLHKSLLYELAAVSTEHLVLPRALERQRTAASIAVALNGTPGGLFGRIRLITNPRGDITDTAMITMIRNSQTDGALYPLRDHPDKQADVIRMFWDAVASIWPKAWAEPPKKSRLTHGAGIVSVGALCDGIAERLHARRAPVNAASIASELRKIAPFCAWTQGHWHLRDEMVQWCSIQNTKRDIGRLAEHLWRSYAAVA